MEASDVNQIFVLFLLVYPWAIPKLDHTSDRMRADDCKFVLLNYNSTLVWCKL